MKKTIILLLGLFLVILILTASAINNSKIQEVRAADEDIPINGYAWSSTIGWISFNCENHDGCEDSNYNVVIKEDGNLVGYAWSSNIGWIDFDPSGSYPGGPDNSAKLNNMENGEVSEASGWARALAGDDANDGWDGWINLSGSWENGVSLDLDTGYFHGYAWGSDVVGWISFNCENHDGCDEDSNYKVSINSDLLVAGPTISNLEIIHDDDFYCSIAEENKASVQLTWDYEGDEDPNEAIIKIEGEDNERTISPVGRTSTTLGELDYGTTYNIEYFYLKVDDVKSNEIEDTAFSTPECQYPIVDFDYDPSENLYAGEEITLTADVTSDTEIEEYKWLINNDDEYTGEEITVQFDSTGDQIIRLTATDTWGYACSEEKTITIGRRPPGWEEITP